MIHTYLVQSFLKVFANWYLGKNENRWLRSSYKFITQGIYEVHRSDLKEMRADNADSAVAEQPKLCRRNKSGRV